MENKSYLYFIDPDDPLFSEKSSSVNIKDKIEKEIKNINRDKWSWISILATILISTAIGIFTQKENSIMVLLLLDILLFIIILMIIFYIKEGNKFNRFFYKVSKLEEKLKIPKVNIT